jgi:hypothetical protein
MAGHFTPGPVRAPGASPCGLSTQWGKRGARVKAAPGGPILLS